LIDSVDVPWTLLSTPIPQNAPAAVLVGERSTRRFPENPMYLIVPIVFAVSIAALLVPQEALAGNNSMNRCLRVSSNDGDNDGLTNSRERGPAKNPRFRRVCAGREGLGD
jgi:hypothetical protein